jgi:tetratricopeptide (TPR) repeat protein
MVEGYLRYSYMKKYVLLPFLGLVIIFSAAGCGKGAASIYLRKGKEYYKKNNYQMAIRFFEKTLEIDSSSVDAKYYRALCYYGLGHNHHACEEMSVLLKQGYGPADSTLKNMGCYYFPEDTARVEKEK